MKADRIISSMPLSAIGLGSESYKFQSTSEILDYYRKRSRYFVKLAGKTAGRVFTTAPYVEKDQP